MAGSNKVGRIFVVLIPVLILLGSSACGMWKKDGPPSSNEKQIVIMVCGDYLQVVVTNQHHERLNSLMALTAYMENQAGLDKARFLKQMESLQNRWTPEQHPLLNLDLTSINIRGNNAKVSFRRRGKGENWPTITIELIWSGTAWQIIDDSLFGPGNYIASLTQAAGTQTPAASQ